MAYLHVRWFGVRDDEDTGRRASIFKPFRKLSLDMQNAIKERKSSLPLGEKVSDHPKETKSCIIEPIKHKKCSRTESANTEDPSTPLSLNSVFTSSEPSTEPTSPFLNSSFERRLTRKQVPSKKQGEAALMMGLSAMYGLLMVVLGLSFPLSSVISSKIPVSYYDGFYMYLYMVAILFLIYVYTTVKRIRFPFGRTARKFFWSQSDKVSRESTSETDACSTPGPQVSKSNVFDFIQKKHERHDAAHHHGSFYLRSGAVVFGIGSMIYSGLDFGQYFELREDVHCQQILRALTPAAKAAFTFIQMYFVFLNSKMFRKRHPSLASFGLMHLVATNLCVWLNVIIQETKHEIIVFLETHHSNDSGLPPYKLVGSVDHDYNSEEQMNSTSDISAHILERHKRGSLIDECHRTNIMGSIVQDASPFLFPCAIEYSLLCAAIMYEMWKTGSPKKHYSRPGTPVSEEMHNGQMRRSPHHYSVDCTGANKGLFLGIFVFVLCIITMILFFVLINKEDYRAVAITEIHLAELVLYLMTFISVVMGVFQVRELQYNAAKSLDLDNILLVIALAGVMTYNSFTIVGGYFGKEKDSVIVMVTALCALVQASTQTLFILDASHRTAFTQEQQHRKPGREIVTFLLVTNFAMWAVITLEKSRTDAHPVQFEFFGLWPWTIITNISMPLSIFYRYHSTVCLFEIWKRSYKIKANYNYSV